MHSGKGHLALPNGKQLDAAFSISSLSGDILSGQVAADLSQVDTSVLWSGVKLVTEGGSSFRIMLTAVGEHGGAFVGQPVSV